MVSKHSKQKQATSLHLLKSTFVPFSFLNTQFEHFFLNLFLNIFAAIINRFSPSLYPVAGYYLYMWNLPNSLDDSAGCWDLSYSTPMIQWAGNYHHWVHVGKELIELEFQVRAQDRHLLTLLLPLLLSHFSRVRLYATT